VIQLNYAFQTEKKLYFVLDYCPGGEMFNLLSKKQRFNQDQSDKNPLFFLIVFSLELGFIPHKLF